MYVFDAEDDKHDLPTRHEKPYLVKKFKPNHLILNDDWLMKDKEDLHASIMDDTELHPYWEKHPAHNLMFEKQTEPRFDPEEFTLFKVSMDVRADW